MPNHDQSNLDDLRHSCAHLLAAAVIELFPGTLHTIGPAIEDGFYFDFDFRDLQISEKDLEQIETKMHQIAKSWHSFDRKEISPQEARNIYKDNVYKLELIDQFAGSNETLTLYQSGNYSDLCRGGHCQHPDKELVHFKLTTIAGAYWRGDSKNKMLTRIYGTCFSSAEELEAHLNFLSEAKKRDHKKLGAQLELFMFHETAPGMPYWLPNGVTLYNELISFWREEHQQRGYQEIVSPLLNKKELYVTSGHFDHYWEDMFVATTTEKEEYGVKAMNCPNAHIVFSSKGRSYKELPLRLSDTDPLHRYELSGTLNGLFRVREFRQDDAHIYVTPDQIESEYQNVFEIVKRFYSVFGLEYSFRLGTRNPDNFMGDVDTWNHAEETLRRILAKSNVDYIVADGDGAFYGPKVDILIKDALKRSWQMGTIQLDFQQPRRFNLVYTDADGSQKTPIAIHRVIYGSLERFIGILIEHFEGKFPTWISPVQVIVLPVSQKHLEYAQSLHSKLITSRIRSSLDIRSEPLSSRIRDAQLAKVPYFVVVGDKESQNQTVSLKKRGETESVVLSQTEFISQLHESIAQKVLIA